MAKVTIIEGENKGIAHSFDEDEVVMGRATDTSLPLKDLRSSRRHARIYKIETSFYIEDLQSQNGTFLNGKKIQKARLSDQDSIRIGSTTILFSLEESLDKDAIFCGYKILEKVQEDETGTMYLAEQVSLKREVLLWVFPFGMLGAEENRILQAQKIFISQISCLSKLFHRNLLMLMDFSMSNQYWYCSFEKIDISSNARNYLKKYHPLSVSKILDIAIQVASGMDYAHSNDVLHFHLTSKNILIQPEHEERVVITEFGVSRFLSESTVSDLNKSTGIFGTLEYIAPEQIVFKEPPSAKTDIYSFGCFLYHILAGVVPFSSIRPHEIVDMHLNQSAKPLSEYRKDVPESLVKFIEKAMQKEPASRQESFREILKDLKEIKVQENLKGLLQSENTGALLKQTLGSKTLLKWWIIFPLISVILGTLVFFTAPLLKNF